MGHIFYLCARPKKCAKKSARANLQSTQNFVGHPLTLHVRAESDIVFTKGTMNIWQVYNHVLLGLEKSLFSLKGYYFILLFY